MFWNEGIGALHLARGNQKGSRNGNQLISKTMIWLTDTGSKGQERTQSVIAVDGIISEGLERKGHDVLSSVANCGPNNMRISAHIPFTPRRIRWPFLNNPLFAHPTLCTSLSRTKDRLIGRGCTRTEYRFVGWGRKIVGAMTG